MIPRPRDPGRDLRVGRSWNRRAVPPVREQDENLPQRRLTFQGVECQDHRVAQVRAIVTRLGQSNGTDGIDQKFVFECTGAAENGEIGEDNQADQVVGSPCDERGQSALAAASRSMPG